MNPDAKKTFWRDSGILVVAYTVLLAWSVVKTIYEDHMSLVARVQQIRAEAGKASNHAEEQYNFLHVQYQQLQVECARTQGANTTLLSQNRDQQNSINNCQTEAIKILTPKDLKFHSVQLGAMATKEEAASKQSRPISILVMTNKPIETTKVIVSCDKPFTLAGESILGSGTVIFSSWNGQLSPRACFINRFGLNLGTSA